MKSLLSITVIVCAFLTTSGCSTAPKATAQAQPIVEIMYLKHIDATGAADTLASRDFDVRIVADNRTNSIIVQGQPLEVERVHAAVSTLDRPS